MAKVSGGWAFSATRNETRTADSTAKRQMVVFEVLDFDSLTNVIINGSPVNVVALIYKKVTITHDQERHYECVNNNPNASFYKDSRLQSEPIWYMDACPATDEYSCTGTRTVEYILCLVVGGNKVASVSLGTVTIGVTASEQESGTYKELIEGAGETFKSSQENKFTVSGERLYGVSVNCGLDCVTFSYDVEKLKREFVSEDDSPANAEDQNAFWEKTKRVVGAMNYYGVYDSKKFTYTGDKEKDFPDKVMSVCYKI